MRPSLVEGRGEDCLIEIMNCLGLIRRWLGWFLSDYFLPNPAQALMLNNAPIRHRKSHFARCHLDLFSCLQSWYIALPASTKLSAYGCSCQRAFEFFGYKISAHRFCYSRLRLKHIMLSPTSTPMDEKLCQSHATMLFNSELLICVCIQKCVCDFTSYLTSSLVQNTSTCINLLK